MEAGVNRRRDLILLAAFTILLHAPFLKQPVQGDEVTYLDIARNVLAHPLTPLNFQYVFQGRLLDASGHPHPPFDAYILALAWLVRGHFSVLFFHLFYLIFPLAISFAGYALACRFTTRPLWGAVLIAASPLVQVNTNTLAGPESPALAFLLVGAAAFLTRRFWLAGPALALAGLTELQALALPPILLLEYWVKRERPSRKALLALAAPYVAMAAWQALQLALTHRLPGAVSMGYARAPGFSGIALKSSSALALLEHLGVLIIFVPLAFRRLWGLVPGIAIAALVHGYPWWERALLAIFVTLGVNALLWLWESRHVNLLLSVWCLFYFAFAATVFFAGASRYLLPLTAPMVLLFVLQFSERPRWLAAALAFSLLLGLHLSFAAYEFSRIYADLPAPPGNAFLVNGDWGFRYYMVAKGGRVLDENSAPVPGEWIATSDLSLGGRFDSLAEEAAVPLRTIDLKVRSPLRLIDLHAHTGFSSVASGLLSFSFSTQPLDRITYSRTSSFLDVQAPWMPTQFSGRLVYLPNAGQSVRLPLDSCGVLRYALFAQGKGTSVFRITGPSGQNLMERTAPVDGDLWEPRTLPVSGLPEATLIIDGPADVHAGWGELVCADDRGPNSAPPPAAPALTYLKLADLRSKPQLVGGWYGIEDGGWRWMSKHAEAVLRVSSESPQKFELHLFFPPSFMERAGGPVTASVTLDGKSFARETYSQPGGYTLSQSVAAGQLTGSTARVTIDLDRAMPPNGSDLRELGAVVSGLGFAAGK